MEITCYLRRVVILQQLLGFLEPQHFRGADPTHGFTRVQLTEHDRKLQVPYNKSPVDRYSKVDGVEKFWVSTPMISVLKKTVQPDHAQK
ncbi:citrate-binding protein-like [Prunus yedoensis var. nudiflora]|uniref:Citrate-binding protein-like n=1 Tax=Prunus yedoensis var. nudiflora TaxID=2094558 RepID=A0A314ZDM2_PRUYE|nr:citrate-binding protein-like [Prunus yedoensis var. nudiflora]